MCSVTILQWTEPRSEFFISVYVSACWVSFISVNVSVCWVATTTTNVKTSKPTEFNNRFSPKCGSPSAWCRYCHHLSFISCRKYVFSSSFKRKYVFLKENMFCFFFSKEICQWDALTRWVTLQPDSDYNPREKCKEKRKLDLEGITREIIDEISDNRRWETSQSDNRRWGKNLNSFRFAFKLSDHAANSPNWRQKRNGFQLSHGELWSPN